MADDPTGVRPIDELDDFKVAEGDPDVRGWEVYGADGDRIGAVDNLLVDTTAMKVRYLDVDLDDDLVGADRDRHVLIPIGYAQLDEDDDRVIVDRLRTAELGSLPAFTHEPVTRDYEAEVRRSFDADFAGEPGGASGKRFYEHDLYDPDRFYGPRRG